MWGLGSFWVTSYDLLKRDIKLYEGRTFYACVLDEGQNIKNQATLASRQSKPLPAASALCSQARPLRTASASCGTCLISSCPVICFPHAAFVEKLERPIAQSKDPQAGQQLSRLVQPFLLRRLKQAAAKGAAPKMEHVRRGPDF